MPTLIDLRRRIKSVKNTQQITKAMKTVSTAKFKKAQRTVLEGRPHWHNLPGLLARICRLGRAPGARRFSTVRDEKKIHVIVITSDKGLCGAFNSNLLARAMAFIQDKAAAARSSLMLVGKKAVNFFKKQPYPVDRAFAEKVDKLGLRELEGDRPSPDAAVHLPRNRRRLSRSTTSSSPSWPRGSRSPSSCPFRREERSRASSCRPDWEPERPARPRALVPLYVEDQLYHGFFESQAAEQAARMMAMDNASKNAEELITDLVLVLNKIRQAGITKELLEIMTAVEALNK